MFSFHALFVTHNLSKLYSVIYEANVFFPARQSMFLLEYYQILLNVVPDKIVMLILIILMLRTCI